MIQLLSAEQFSACRAEHPAIVERESAGKVLILYKKQAISDIFKDKTISLVLGFNNGAAIRQIQLYDKCRSLFRNFSDQCSVSTGSTGI